MNAQAPVRGAELVAAGRHLGVGPQWLARLWSGGWHKVLDRIDAGLAAGSLETGLPDGTTRLLGGRADGFAAEVKIDDWRALLRLATGGSVGWYEAWEAGEWTSPDPVELFALFAANAHTLGDTARAKGPWRWLARGFHWLNRNTRRGALRNIHAHYDLGNDFYVAWLGGSMAYSSAIFEDWGSPTKMQQRLDGLDYAQLAKITTIANRAAVPAGGTALEIGCGWGVQAFALAGRECWVDAISLSDAQLDYARSKPNRQRRVNFRKQDYRDVAGQYDAIVSVEMVEALGRKNWPGFMDCLARNLKPGGRAVLQFISLREDLFEVYAESADFIQAYVFPGGLLIKTSEFRSLAGARGMEWTDQIDFGDHYAETLSLWRANFDRAVDDGRLPAGFDRRFCDLWRYYLMYCEGGFLGGGIDVHQVTLVKS
jgi:cyclopropane-fatty-acyl-phospholipid synthase